jgi:hypothetical protein
MRFLHYLPFVAAVVAGIALLAGAGRRSTLPNTATYPFTPPPRAVADAVASQTLAAAAAALQPERVAWLETTVRQRVCLPDVEYVAEGCFRTAPNNRYRLELRSGGGTLLAVSDGACVWRAHRTGDEDWTDVRRVNLRRLADDRDAEPQSRDEYLRGPAFSGPGPLLHNLRKRMLWVKRAAVTRAGRQLIELTGVWPEARAAALAPNGSAWPDGVPDRCRLFLDADTLWPRRVEWWGPAAQGKELVRLAQLELRDPVLNHALPPEECARAFTFQPGSAKVVDDTTRVSAELTRTAAP